MIKTIDPIERLEKLIKKGFIFEISTATAALYKRDKNGLGQNPLIQVDFDDENGLAGTIARLLNPFGYFKKPATNKIIDKLQKIIYLSTCGIEISYKVNSFEIEEMDDMGDLEYGITLEKAIDNFLVAIS